MTPDFCPELEERLVRYCAVETMSDETSATVPSTPQQFDLQRILEDELHALGAQAVLLAENGFLYATVPASPGAEEAPTIALLAHVDTVANVGGTHIVPRVIHAYDGGSITFPDAPGQVLSPEAFPYLARKAGDDIITASGGTLLGADDKAGVAIIMAVARRLLEHPEMPHPEVRICFTPDEEIGSGIRHIDLARMHATFAYTLDGGEPAQLGSETFSADKAAVRITGVSAHPGKAKGVMVNALQYAATVATALPRATRTPETTDKRQGFIHLYKMEGSAAECTMHFILRDYELDGLEAHGAALRALCEAVQLAEPRLGIECIIAPQYRNMRYWLERDMRPVKLAEKAIREERLEPVADPIRGGTDGSQLTEMGVPTPNLFTGMQNGHGPLEWISVQDMALSVRVCLRLLSLWATERA